jgi:hypothetical protein
MAQHILRPLQLITAGECKLLVLLHVLGAWPRWAKVVSIGGCRSLPARSADGDEPPHIRIYRGLTFPFGGIASSCVGLTPPPPIGRAADTSLLPIFADLPPPLGRLPIRLLPPCGSAPPPPKNFAGVSAPPLYGGIIRRKGGQIVNNRGNLDRSLLRGQRVVFWDRNIVSYRRKDRRHLLRLVVDELLFVSPRHIIICRNRWNLFFRSSRRLAFAKDGLLGLFLGPSHARID